MTVVLHWNVVERNCCIALERNFYIALERSCCIASEHDCCIALERCCWILLERDCCIALDVNVELHWLRYKKVDDEHTAMTQIILHIISV